MLVLWYNDRNNREQILFDVAIKMVKSIFSVNKKNTLKLGSRNAHHATKHNANTNVAFQTIKLLTYFVFLYGTVGSLVARTQFTS